MDTQPDSTPAGVASATPRQSRQHATPSDGTDAPRYVTAGRSRCDPPPWWLTREPSRLDQVCLHLRCAWCHGRELARELWRALYAGACADRWWPSLSRWMWQWLLLAILLAACLVIGSGCREKAKPGPATPLGPSSPAASLGTATANEHSADAAAADARAAQQAAQDTRLGKVAADVDAAGKAVGDGRTADASGALGVASAHLEGVPRDPQEAQALARAERERAAGRAEQADADLATLRDAAKADGAELERLRLAVGAAEKAQQQAERERDAAQRELIAAGERGAAALAKALDDERRGVLKGQVAKLSWIGIGCCAGAALALGAGIALCGFAALRRVGPAAVVLGVVGLGCLGAAQIIGAPWFLPVVGGCAVLGVGWFAVWAYRHQQRGDLAQELATRTAKVAAVAKTAVPVLDVAYDEADESVRAWLDAHVFNRLSSVMDKEEKAAVHAVRAEAVSKAASAAPAT